MVKGGSRGVVVVVMLLLLLLLLLVEVRVGVGVGSLVGDEGGGVVEEGVVRVGVVAWVHGCGMADVFN